MSRKCYAWMPGDPDAICALPEGHAEAHSSQWHTWARVTEPELAEAIRGIHAANDTLAASFWKLTDLALRDGRHDIREAITGPDQYRSSAVQRVSRTAVEWREQLFSERRFAVLLAIPGMRERARKLTGEADLSFPQALERLYREWSNK